MKLWESRPRWERRLICESRFCLRLSVWQVIGLTDHGNRHDGWYCNKHSNARIEANVMLGRAGMWGKYIY